MSLPVIRGASAALYPVTLTLNFRTIVGRFQNGAEQRQVANTGALVSLEIPYAKLTRAEKNTVKAAVTSAKGRFDTTLSVTMGAVTYTNLVLDSDEFAAVESVPTQYAAPLKLTQTVAQNLMPGTPGTAFPTLANGAMGILPYTQRKIFQTISAKVDSGPTFTYAEFGGGLTGYPTDGLAGWILDQRMLSDADAATLMAHYIANWGRAFSFPFTDEDAVTYSHAIGNGSPHYASDSMSFRYNGPNDVDVKIAIDITYN